VAALAEHLARSPDYAAQLAAKAWQLAAAERHRPLAAYRAAELAIMRRNFCDPREPYPQLRRAFVYKDKPSRTPPHLARHQTHPYPSRPGQARSQQTSSVAQPTLFCADR
jgi:hypothetical protein